MARDMLYPASYAIMVARYLLWRHERFGNRSPCFTYEGIFSWVKRSEHYRGIARTTIERVIRRMTEDGYLKRVRERPRAVFCVTRKMIDLLKSTAKNAGMDWEEVIGE